MNSAAEKSNNYLDKVSCKDLRRGMYVQELDRPWLETSFMFQGFCIRNDEEIAALQKYCEYVFVNKAMEEIDPWIINTGTARNETDSRIITSSEARKVIDSSVFHMKVESEQSMASHVRALANKEDSGSRYSSTVSVEKELETASKIYEESKHAIEDVFRAADNNGAINLNHASNTTSHIVDSVLRNPDALMLLQRIKRNAHYRYTHAINCCALAATFCLHLGFSKSEIQDISMGGLLLDIGFTKLPESLINTQSVLNPLMLKVVRQHVNYGMEILNNTSDLPPIVRDMIMTHHERINGNGYPKALKGEQIPVCGRIAAILDCYDAMISDRPHKKGMSPIAAICAMYSWRNIDFHEDLIEKFIQCVGAYPTGTLVELNSGQIGIVISQNRLRRLYPKILLILSADRTRYEFPDAVDLWEQSQMTSGQELEIKKAVDADDLGVDLSDYYI